MTLSSALVRLEEIHSIVAGRHLAIFLDYDGTLTPLVLHPENAVLGDEMRRVLRHLASQCTVVEAFVTFKHVLASMRFITQQAMG
jgi:trehalose-phosphatase